MFCSFPNLLSMTSIHNTYLLIINTAYRAKMWLETTKNRERKKRASYFFSFIKRRVWLTKYCIFKARPLLRQLSS